MINYKESKLGIGTVQFGLKYGISNFNDKTSPNEVKKILQFAYSNQIITVDTAEVYGNSENVLGDNEMSKFKVISKCFLGDKNSFDPRLSINDSLEKLKIKSLYGYLIHNPEHLMTNANSWSIMQELKAKELVSKVGYSLYDPEELIKLLDMNLVPDIIQIPYNFLDRRFEPFLCLLNSIGCEIHVRSVFLQGLFFLDPIKISDYFITLKPILKEIQSKSVNLNAALLQFVTNNKYIDKVILGIENAEQLVQNFQNLNVKSSIPNIDNYSIDEEILLPKNWPKN